MQIIKKVALLPLFLLIFLFSANIHAQQTLTGSLEANTSFFLRDSTIGATGTPQYDNLLSSAEAWLALNYFNLDWDFTAGIRFDLYNNSNLIDPTSAYSGIGLGRIYVTKKVDNLTVTGGHFYDQFGSGITFRAFEERALAIDNAIFGVHAQYNFNQSWLIKGFTGRQKNLFDFYSPIIKGLNAEGFEMLGENISIAPGVSIVNRTLDQASMDVIVSNIQSYPVEQRFIPKYNTFAMSAYNRLNVKDFSWFIEYAYKTNEAIVNGDGEMVDRPGNVLYSTLTFTRSKQGRGFGITGQVKRTENFVFRTSPNETLLDGLITFLPPMARTNTFQLLARYNAATQYLGEMAYQVDLITTPVKGISFSANYSNIDDLSGRELFREVYGDVTYKRLRDWKITAGLQHLTYNQQAYESKGDEVNAITPFTEITYRIDRRKSLRTELQYMHTDDDFGSWLFALVEFSIAPKFSFTISDMYNVNPTTGHEAIHYYTVLGVYNKGPNRFSLGYVKQVEGIVCTGGICRYEPAFNGVKFSLNSTF